MFTKEQFSQIKNFEEILELSGQDFEWFTKFLLEKLNHTKVRVTPYKYDGGIDAVSFYKEVKHYTQSKRWKIGPSGQDQLPVKEVRELGGCMLRDRITNGIFVTTLPTSKTSLKEAQQMNIKMIDREVIKSIMKEVNPQFDIETPPVEKKMNNWFKKLLKGFLWILQKIGKIILFVISTFFETPTPKKKKYYKKRKKR